MDDIYENIEEYNPNNECKILISFDNMIGDILSNKNLQQRAISLFIRGRKLTISLVFITQPHFAVPKNIRLNFTHYLISKISNKEEFLQIPFDHSSNFMNICKKCTSKLYSLLVNDTNLSSHNPLCFSFRCNLFKKNIKTKHFN